MGGDLGDQSAAHSVAGLRDCFLGACCSRVITPGRDPAAVRRANRNPKPRLTSALFVLIKKSGHPLPGDRFIRWRIGSASGRVAPAIVLVAHVVVAAVVLVGIPGAPAGEDNV